MSKNQNDPELELLLEESRELILKKSLLELPNHPKKMFGFLGQTLKNLLESEPKEIFSYHGVGNKKAIAIKNWILSLGGLFEMDSCPFLNSKFWNLIELKASIKGFEKLWRNAKNFERAIVSAGLNPEDYHFLKEDFWEKEFKKNKSK